jgi:PAS domain S-box-containing protein
MPGLLNDPAAVEATAAWLSRQLPSYTFRPVPLSREELQEQITARRLDFVITDPVQCIAWEAQHDARIMAMMRHHIQGKTYETMAGTLCCLKDAGIIDAGSLRGRKVAATHPEALGGWLAVRRALKQRRINPETDLNLIIFTGDEARTIQAVLDGEAHAGAVCAGTLERMAARGDIRLGQLQVLPLQTRFTDQPLPLLASTYSYPSWCFAAARAQDPDMIRTVTRTLLAMPPQEADPPGVPACAGWTPPREWATLHNTLTDLGSHPYWNARRMSFMMLLREYMYAFVLGGISIIILLVSTLHVTGMNRALRREIEERRRAQHALQQSIQRFEHIVACSGDWIWETDATGCFTYSSDMVQDMLGYAPTEITGQHMYDYFTGTEREKCRTPQDDMFSGRQRIHRRQFRMVTREGRVAILQISAEPVHDGKDRLIGYRGVARDVTREVRFVRL